MIALHDLRLADFLALDATGEVQPGQSVEQDMGALSLAYADQWRLDTLSLIAGRERRYALAADWLSTVVLLARQGPKRGQTVGSADAWDVVGIFSENLLFIGRPHRGALLSVDLQLFGYTIRGGRVGRLPPYTPVSLASRKAAYRIAVRRAIAAGQKPSESVFDDYRALVKEKKQRDEAGQLRQRGADQMFSEMRS